MAALPLRNTSIEDIASFQNQREQFLKDQYNFKMGNSLFGLPCASLIRSMYVELIYSTHAEKKEDEAKEFLSKITALENDMKLLLDTPKTTGDLAKTDNYKKKVAALDELYLLLKKYKRDCGYG